MQNKPLAARIRWRNIGRLLALAVGLAVAASTLLADRDSEPAGLPADVGLQQANSGRPAERRAQVASKKLPQPGPAAKRAIKRESRGRSGSRKRVRKRLKPSPSQQAAPVAVPVPPAPKTTSSNRASVDLGLEP